MGFSFALVGICLLFVSINKYHRLISSLQKSSYRMTKRDLRRRMLQVFLYFLFLGSYLVDLIQEVTAARKFIFSFEACLFFACSVFFYLMINEQIDTENALQQRKREILSTFGNAIDRKDVYTGGHSQHVYRLVELLYRQLPEAMHAVISLPKLLDAAILHDIGKIAMSDEILKKDCALTDAEWQLMRGHAREGKRLLDDTCFSQIADWVLYHHERMDGAGYEGLPGAAIPLESRMIAIADTFSALTTDRGYRKAKSHDQAILIMKEVAGTQLDGELLGCFLQIPRGQLEQLNRQIVGAPKGTADLHAKRMSTNPF